MTITARYSSRSTLTVQGDALSNALDVARNAAGTLLVNGNAVPVAGGPATIANTRLIQIAGADGDDTLTLTESNGTLPKATLSGGNGNDRVAGGSGDDLLLGDAGNDTLFGQGGVDLMHGGDGNDVLTGGDGNDFVNGNAGDDRLIWNPGDDTDVFEGGSGIDTAEVNGGNGAEVFTMSANVDRVRLDRIAPAPFSIDAGTIEAFVVNMNGGDDSFSATGNLAALVGITVDGGAGNDSIVGSNGADRLFGGDDNDFIDGQQGADHAFLGAGDDVFQWDPGDGNDVIEGQEGSDKMLFLGANAAETVNIAANGARVLFQRDVANVTMDLDDTEAIEFRALGGADTIVIGDLSGTDLTRIDVDLRSAGGGGDAATDTITVNATNGDNAFGVSGNAGGITVFGLQAAVHAVFHDGDDRLTLNAQGGNDVVDASGLGADGMRLTMNGGLGNDVLRGGAGADLINGGDGNDLAVMGDGDDTFAWNPGDDSDTVEGQAGSDTLLFNGANVAETITLSANGGRAVFARNIGNVVVDLDDTETIRFNALGGADTITVNDLSGTDVSVVDINLASSGGGGDGAVDTVIVNATGGDDVVLVIGDGAGATILGLAATINLVGFEAGVDRIIVNLRAGDDVLEASGLAAGGPLLTGNGDEGDDVLIGGDGNDTLNGGAGDDVLIGGPGTDVLDGGADDNVVIQLVGLVGEPAALF